MLLPVFRCILFKLLELDLKQGGIIDLSAGVPGFRLLPFHTEVIHVFHVLDLGQLVALNLLQEVPALIRIGGSYLNS